MNTYVWIGIVALGAGALYFAFGRPMPATTAPTTASNTTDGQADENLAGSILGVTRALAGVATGAIQLVRDDRNRTGATGKPKIPTWQQPASDPPR